MPQIFQSGNSELFAQRFPGVWLLIIEEFRNRMNDFIFNGSHRLSNDLTCIVTPDCSRKYVEFSTISSLLKYTFPCSMTIEYQQKSPAVDPSKAIADKMPKIAEAQLVGDFLQKIDTNALQAPDSLQQYEKFSAIEILRLCVNGLATKASQANVRSDFSELGNVSRANEFTPKLILQVCARLGGPSFSASKNGTFGLDGSAMNLLLQNWQINKKMANMAGTFLAENLLGKEDSYTRTFYNYGARLAEGTYNLAGRAKDKISSMWTNFRHNYVPVTFSTPDAIEKAKTKARVNTTEEKKKRFEKAVESLNLQYEMCMSLIGPHCRFPAYQTIAMLIPDFSAYPQVAKNLAMCELLMEEKCHDFDIGRREDQVRQVFQNCYHNLINNIMTSAYGKFVKENLSVQLDPYSSAIYMKQHTLTDFSAISARIFKNVLCEYCPATSLSMMNGSATTSTISVSPSNARIFKYDVNSQNNVTQEDVTRNYTAYDFPKLARRHREKFVYVNELVQRKYNAIREANRSISGTSLTHPQVLVYINEFGKFFLDTNRVQVSVQYHHNNAVSQISALEMTAFEKGSFTENSSFRRLLELFSSGSTAAIKRLLVQNPLATSLGFTIDPFTELNSKTIRKLDPRLPFKSRKERNRLLNTCVPVIATENLEQTAPNLPDFYGHVNSQQLQDYNLSYLNGIVEQRSQANKDAFKNLLYSTNPYLCDLSFYSKKITDVELQSFMTEYFKGSCMQFDESMQILYRKSQLARSDNGKYFTNEDKIKLARDWSIYLLFKRISGGPAVFRPMPFEILIDYRSCVDRKDNKNVSCNGVLLDEMPPTIQRDNDGREYLDYLGRASVVSSKIVTSKNEMKEMSAVPIENAKNELINASIQLLNEISQQKVIEEFGRDNVLDITNKLEQMIFEEQKKDS